MPFEIWKQEDQLAEFVVIVIFSPIGVAVTALRFVATRQRDRRPGLEDWLAAAAALFFILVNITNVVALAILNGRDIAVVSATNPSDYRKLRICDMAGLYFYFAHSLAVKFSVLALYYRLFGVKRSYKMCIYAIAAAQLALVVALCIVEALLCIPIGRFFDLSIPGTCKDDGIVVIAGETPNSFLDFVVVALAIVMIRSLQLSTHLKWRLRVLFGLGAIVGILGFIKVGLTYSGDIYAFNKVGILGCLQMFLSLLCCCLPVFRPLLPTSAFWGRVLKGATFGLVTPPETATPTSPHMIRPSHLSASRKRRAGNQGWDQLDNDSTKALAWPETTYMAETHALSDFHGAHTQSPGIRVQKQFQVV